MPDPALIRRKHEQDARRRQREAERTFADTPATDAFDRAAALVSSGVPQSNVRIVPVGGLDDGDSGFFAFEQLLPPTAEQLLFDPNATGTWTVFGTPFDASDLPGEGGLTASERLSNELQSRGLDLEQSRIDVSNRNAATAEANAAESGRANRAREAEAARQRALQASTDALSAYLQGTQLADSRRLSSFQEARALLPQLIDPDRKFFGGQGPGGFLDQFSQKFFGKPFEGAKVVPKTFRPGELAKAPTPGQIGSEIVAGVADIRSKG